VYILPKIVSAAAKNTLFGEHYVVFGEPAIAMAPNLQVYSKSRHARFSMSRKTDGETRSED